MELGQALKIIRSELKLTQKGLAEAIKSSHTTINQVESGKQKGMSEITMLNLYKFLNCTKDDFEEALLKDNPTNNNINDSKFDSDIFSHLNLSTIISNKTCYAEDINESERIKQALILKIKQLYYDNIYEEFILSDIIHENGIAARLGITFRNEIIAFDIISANVFFKFNNSDTNSLIAKSIFYAYSNPKIKKLIFIVNSIHNVEQVENYISNSFREIDGLEFYYSTINKIDNILPDSIMESNIN